MLLWSRPPFSLTHDIKSGKPCVLDNCRTEIYLLIPYPCILFTILAFCISCLNAVAQLEALDTTVLDQITISATQYQGIQVWLHWRSLNPRKRLSNFRNWLSGFPMELSDMGTRQWYYNAVSSEPISRSIGPKTQPSCLPSPDYLLVAVGFAPSA